MRTACAGRGAGGSGRLNDEGIGFAVEAYEYVGDAGIAGSLLGVGEGERERADVDMFVYFEICLVPSKRLGQDRLASVNVYEEEFYKNEMNRWYIWLKGSEE